MVSFCYTQIWFRYEEIDMSSALVSSMSKEVKAVIKVRGGRIETKFYKEKYKKVPAFLKTGFEVNNNSREK